MSTHHRILELERAASVASDRNEALRAELQKVRARLEELDARLEELDARLEGTADRPGIIARLTGRAR